MTTTTATPPVFGGIRRERVLTVLMDANWHTTQEINSVQVGGTEGVRRLRELRADGYNIVKRRMEGSTQFEYRLISTVVL